VVRIGRDTFGPRAGLLMALTVAATPPVGGVGFLLFGRQALSETPAMAMVLLGVWCLIRSWAGGAAAWAIAGGVACGIGILSKSQFAFALLPALALVSAARWHLGLESWRRAVAPASGALLDIFAWWLLGLVATPPAVQQSNSALLAQGIEANIVTGLWGASLSHQAMARAAWCALAAAWGARRFAIDWRARRLSRGSWLVATLTIAVAINTAWFVLLSIGWTRYAYLGWIAALMLSGLALCEGLALADEAAPSWARRRWRAVAAALVGIAVVSSLGPVFSGAGSDGAERMSAYIDANIGRGNVVETWEWELSGIGAHTAFHFPGQRYVYLATYQQGRKMPFVLPYDPLQADPAYLLLGPFGRLTGIYPSDGIDAHFDKVTELPPYVLYARRRSQAGHTQTSTAFTPNGAQTFRE
jgi:4-amino-4-deoxy-L-arabinose transferase-like glycosyltransferase